MIKDALLSNDGVYRYSLERTWKDETTPGPDGPIGWVLWVMLNPSKADAEIDDLTITKCIGFSRRWGYDGLYVVNLYGLRSTDPQQLLNHEDPAGPFNDDAITAYAMSSEVSTVVAAWGAHPMARGRGDEVRYLIECQERQVMCLGLTNGGFPRHPSRLGYETPLVEW